MEKSFPVRNWKAMNRRAFLKKTAIGIVGVELVANLPFGSQAYAAAPANTLKNEWRFRLDGSWQFSTDPNFATWDSITVPGNWDTLPAYSKYKGTGWYRRSFSVPDDLKGKPIRLCFGAVFHDSNVTINGELLGNHVGGYTPFEFDVTDHLKYQAENTIVVSANNIMKIGAFWKWGGISRSVNLIANNPARIVWQHIRTEPDLSSGKAMIFVRYKLTNSGDKPLEVRLDVDIDGKSEREMDRKAILAPHSGMFLEASTQLPRRRVKLWDFDHPNLYRLTTRLLSGDIVQHEQSDRFGIRKIEITKDSLLLNGERVRLVGFNRVSDSCATGNTEPRSLIVTDVDLMKRCGANMTRIMHTPQSPDMLDYLDEKGMLIIEEIPIPAEADISNHPENPLTRQWIREMIERDYNHPCIIGWSVCNECYMVYEYVRQMISYMRENLDSHRLLTYVTNSAAGAKMNPTNEALEYVDLICHNMYFYYKQDVATVVHEKWPDKPIFFSELGVRQFGAKSDSTIPDLEKLWARIQKPYVVGGSLWTFNDYRSDYVGTPPTGIREWGVVDEQRRPKAAYYQVRQLFSPVREFTVTEGKVLVQPRSPDEIPSYTLRGYKIRWTLRDTGGSVKEHGEITLPELKPGAPAWSTPLAARGPGLSVALVAPTGYDMVEWNSEESSLQ